MKFKKTAMVALALGVPVIAISAVYVNTDGFSTDNSNTVGSHSMSLGTDNEANDRSLSVGIDNLTRPSYGMPGRSLSVGELNSASRDSIASGYDNGSFWGSFSQGLDNYANYYSSALGANNHTFRYGYAIGRSNSAQQFTIAIGEGNSSLTGTHANSGGVENSGIVLVGKNNATLRKNATTPYIGIQRNILIGTDNISDVDDAVVLGEGNFGVEGAVVVGNYNDPTDPNLANAAVVLSAGTDGAGNERNGLIVKDNGDIIVPKAQGDIPMGIYGN